MVEEYARRYRAKRQADTDVPNSRERSSATVGISSGSLFATFPDFLWISVWIPFPDKNGDCDHKWRFLPFFEFLGVRGEGSGTVVKKKH
jgi:hypothetical protein